MATPTTNPALEAERPREISASSWLAGSGSTAPGGGTSHRNEVYRPASRSMQSLRPAGGDALQALLAFSALHQQVRQRRALASPRIGIDTVATAEFEPSEQFVLDEVLQLVAERAIAITGADGLGIALAEKDEIVLRASAGIIKPDVGARIQRDSAFSGACFRTAQIIRCDDTETDDRVNLYNCRQLGARSMVAVPLCGRRRVIGLLEAFSAEPFGFNDSDVTSLELLAELILGALKPEDEDRFADSAQAAETKLAATAPPVPVLTTPIVASVEPNIPKKISEQIAAIALAESALTETGLAKIALPETKPEIKPDIKPETKTKKDSIESAPALADETASSLSTGLISEPVKVVEEPALFQSVSETPNRNPGMILVLVLIVVCALLGGGIWWKLKNAQLGTMIKTGSQTEPTIVAQSTASTKPPSTPVAQAPTAPTTSTIEQANSTSSTNVVDEDSSADLTPENTTPQAPSKLPRITGIRHWSSADSSTVVLDLEDQVQYEAHRLANPDRIYFDLHDTSLAQGIEGKIIDIGDPLLSRVRVAQPSPGLTRVVLETRGNSNYSVSLEPNPYRLVVQVRKIGADPKAQINLFPGAEAERRKLAIVVPPPTKEDLQLRARVAKMRIVIDAGHGGWDLGTVGRHGLLEKDLVLEIAQRLGKLLESRLGAEVILTRNDDNYIPLDERAGMANQAQADLFVSVHANYSDLPSARGVETYYTNFFSSPNAKDIETRQNGSKAPATNAVLSPADLHDRIEQSRRLAASVQRSLYGTLSADNPGLRDRGVKEASYVVLTETAMPGILAEVSFVSSPTDEQKLRSDGYREQIAEALYKGIARYAASSHPVKIAAR
jgi:N-acetylmuramoyl-L-alanine amidase/putative methionine-R-sulfoxide reductase with GAF domain